MMKLRFWSLTAAMCMTAFSMAHVEIFSGVFSGLSEVPPNASPATGLSTVTVDLDLITMRVQSSFSGLIGTTTASHLHVGGGPGTNGGVASQTPSFVGFPIGVTSGTYDHTFDMAQASSYNPSYITGNGGTVTSAFNALLTALRQGRAYHNVHTSAFPGGEIRADLQAVPEPASMGVMGLALLGFVSRRRKKI
ncbi:MAG: CHRD domain-containing protein [Fimbriimonadaceae bacterium]|nr:CHRD domain-containing protein [Fimbriimonadaceae bacterium]